MVIGAACVKRIGICKSSFIALRSRIGSYGAFSISFLRFCRCYQNLFSGKLE